MKTDIILSGVGGQGILSIAAAIGMAAIHENLFIKQAEVHGMSQRGGAVQSNLRISNTEIASDLIPHGQADIILSVEPMEALRYLPFLSSEGWIVTNTAPFINIADYPDSAVIMQELKKHKNLIALDADKIATELGTKKASNMVMLGAASPFMQLSEKACREGIRQIFERKGRDIIDLNLAAFDKGRKLAGEYQQSAV
ncbi:MAG TPA: indolepyruvate oxidoreductase subunit beta [Bacteroidales bacterium]|nr:indolepyruvate oxidoreductase subunit beta [Bacteroidales bacterium]